MRIQRGCCFNETTSISTSTMSSVLSRRMEDRSAKPHLEAISDLCSCCSSIAQQLTAEMAGGATPLTPNVGTARSWRSGQIIKLLVEDGADVNARDEMGHTPLWYAAWTTRRTWEYLLEHGGDVEMMDDSGISAWRRIRQF
ncbi:hypothetical protein BDW71DRAFT_184540 [Aspergillus fruticulosus]